MTAEDRIKSLIGDLIIKQFMLEAEIVKLNDEIAKLKAEKNASVKLKTVT